MVNIAPLTAGDIPALVGADGGDLWQRDEAFWRRCLDEQSRGERTTAIASEGGAIRGYAQLIWKSAYGSFRAARTPEIRDLMVAEKARRQGIGTGLVVHLGRTAHGAGARQIGSGVGLNEGYGAAQRLFVKLGFMPDGRGLTAGNAPVFPGDSVTADDTLLLWLVRNLP
jgi:GNAT superfamily N-acetyltransferase